jgi:hypothetical protein
MKIDVVFQNVKTASFGLKCVDIQEMEIFLRLFFANRGDDDAACLKARKEEPTKSGGNIGQKYSINCMSTHPSMTLMALFFLQRLYCCDIIVGNAESVVRRG